MFKAPSRKYYNTKHYNLDFESKTFSLTKEYHKKLLLNKPGTFNGFRKMTGTALGDILEVDNFKSQFAAFARLCNLSMPVLDPKYVNAGVILEPKILELVEKSIKEKLNRYPANEYNYDYFKDNDFFGGLPDGFAPKKKIIIEIKTTNIKNYDFWIKNTPPVGYIKQAQLYAYLMGVSQFSIVAIFLENDDYNNPELVDINKRKIKNFNFTVNLPQVKDDIDFCMKWFNEYTKTGISPKWKNSVDEDLIQYLDCKSENEWDILYNKWIELGKVPKPNE
ncbi:MAGa7180 family putative nuclease [Metamycoplasma buccale]|uniref:MAGa7180 family putative nuclease n=1 Tax=Metamycoplasma buccale TaxID=55602 RepID=UPI00398E7483